VILRVDRIQHIAVLFGSCLWTEARISYGIKRFLMLFIAKPPAQTSPRPLPAIM
jgi:hypothetical protein